jgi:hypothetical protein
VSFVLSVPEHHIIGPTQIVGEGKVVRVEPCASGRGFAAVSCKRPLSKLDERVPPSVSFGLNRTGLEERGESRKRNGLELADAPVRGVRSCTGANRLHTAHFAEGEN